MSLHDSLLGLKYGFESVAYQLQATRNHLVIALLVMMSSLIVAPVASAATGIEWLAAQSKSDGSYANQSDVSTAYQSTTETLSAFAALGESDQPGIAAAVQFIDAEAFQSTENISRKIITYIEQGLDASALISELNARQSIDGGFGEFAGYDVTIIDTAFALQALVAAGEESGDVAWYAANFLLSKQSPDSSWCDGTNTTCVYTTAHAIQALLTFRTSVTGVWSAINSAQAYLLGQRGSDLLWGEGFLSSEVLLALLPNSSDLTILSGSVSALEALQNVDGSWNGDAFETALALRAIAVSRNLPPAPNLSNIVGEVIDVDTGVKLSGVSVALVGPTTAVSTTTNGAFYFGNVAPGAYSLAVSYLDYAPISATFTAYPGKIARIGTIPLSRSTAATYGMVRGVVTDAVTGLPIEAAVVSVSGIAATVQTNNNGEYLVSGIPPSAVMINISKDGYSTSSASVTVSEGSISIFSPALSIAADPTLSQVRGTIVDGVTGLPLSGVTVTATGSVIASATTDSLGQYFVAGLSNGLTIIEVSLAGYDTLVRSINIFSATSTDFSPKLYPTGTTPPDANIMGVSGIAIDSSTNAPLSGVSISATYDGATTSIVSGADGRFQLTGILTPYVNLNFSQADYSSVRFDVILAPLTVLDIGQVRMRPVHVQNLLPDLVISSIDTANVTSNPSDLSITGSLAVEVKNIGTTATSSMADVVAFIDVDKNNRFDSGVDSVLGSASGGQVLNTNASEIILITVHGFTPFRDAPISVWVDHSQAVVESDESNNASSSASACRITPPTNIGTFNPVVKYHALPTDNISALSVVSNLNDDNGDGVVDEFDIPDIIVPVITSGQFSGGVLKAISGDDGHVLFTTSTLYTVATLGDIAVGDIDGDGLVEIVAAFAFGDRLVAFENTGEFKWLSTIDTLPGRKDSGGSISIANLDGVGLPEIIVGASVYDANGTLLADGRDIGGGTGFKLYTTTSVVADIDLDGLPEIIAGRTVYDFANGMLTIKWTRTDLTDGFAGIANFDDDPYPEIVLVGDKVVYLLNHDGTNAELWGGTSAGVAIPGGGEGGAPTISDLDGDGLPEIGVAGATAYTVIDTDGSVLWSSQTKDASSRVTGSTSFDFEGDGVEEVVYRDERFLRIYRGTDGQILYERSMWSGTATEYPVVVDIDNDGHAEIVISSDNLYGGTAENKGIYVIEDAADSWVATRNIWNQHTYHITNVNDDGSIPATEQNSWSTHNTYRLNAFLDRSPFSQADLTASVLKVIDNGFGQPVSLSARIGNAGEAPSPKNVMVSFYEGDPSSGGMLLGSIPLAALAAGNYVDIRLDGIPALSGNQVVYVVADSLNAAEECNELNNTAAIPVNLSSLGNMMVATDQSQYAPNSPVVLIADVANTGSLPGDYTIDLSIEDASGVTVQVFATQSVSGLAVADAIQLTENWNTGTILAGIYQLHGILKSLDGTVLSDVSSSFHIGQADVAAPAASLRTTLDRTTYNTSDTVLIQDLATNTTANVLLENVQLQVTVTNASAAVVFTDARDLGQMAPGALRNVTSSYGFIQQQPGTYTVTSTLTDAVHQVLLATNTVQYTVHDDLNIVITGNVTAQAASLNIGEQQVCTSTVTNAGVNDAAALQLRQVIALPTTGQEYDNFVTSMNLPAGVSQAFNRSLDTTGLFAGVYVCVLQHNVGGVWKTLDYKPFTLINQPPVADAGVGQSGYVTDIFTLDGSASSDPNGNSLTYRWTLLQQPLGSVAVLANATTVNPTLIPDVRGQYIAQLIVNDGMVDSAPATVLIDVLNSPPVADAGPDQLVHIGDVATLTGILSSDADGDALAYHWTLVSKPVGSLAALSDTTAQNQTLAIDKHGSYTLELVVNDGFVDSAPATVTLTVENILPVAVAGPDQIAYVGETVTLNGFFSSDADGDPLTYRWTLISAPTGSTATLTNADTVTPTLVVDMKGDFVIDLVVNDGYDDSLPSTTTISVTNTPPVAEAGADQLIHLNDVVTLDGSASTDADGDALTYRWTIVSRPAGSLATLSDPTAVMPTLAIDALGYYVIELVVNDGQMDSVMDPVILNAVNVTPVANAGLDQSVTLGQTVQLDGTLSSDADGDALTYRWSILDAPVGSVSQLSDTTAANPTLALDVFGVYTLELVVNDGIVDSAPDTVVLNVVNTPPVANAGPDQAVFVGSNALLDGGASHDADNDPLTYRWSLIQQPAGGSAVLVDTTTATPSIVIDEQGLYIAQLIVNDGIVDSAPDTVVLNVANVRPVANAGPDQTVTVPATVTLDGSASYDADSDPLTYQWSLSSAPTGSTATLSDPTAINPTLSADLAGTYVLQLIVSDGTIDSLPDTVTLTGEAVCMPEMMAYGYDGRVDLDWNAMSYVDHYRVYRNTAGETAPYALLSGSHHSSMGGYSDYSVTNGTTYYYKVDAVKTNGTVCHSPIVSTTPQGGMGGGGMGGH